MAAAAPGFRIAGIPVKIQPVFLMLIIFIGLFYPPAFIVTWVLIATFSVLVHEFGHAFAFRAFGLKPRITLHAMGGLTSASGDSSSPAFTPGRSIVTSFAGPLSALVLFGIPALWYAGLHGLDPWAGFKPSHASLSASQVIIGQIVYVNVGWSILNLLPVLPLDGGNITASMCELVVPTKGRRVANVLSIVFAAVLGLWAMKYVGVIGMVFAIVFIGMNIGELSRRDESPLDDQLNDAFSALLNFDPVRADHLAQTVIVSNPSPARLGWAIELSAWARIASGDYWGAQHVLVTMPPGTAPSASIRGALALALGNVAEGVSTLTWALAFDPSKNARVLGALAAAQSGQAVAIAHELVLMGPDGVEAAHAFARMLDYAGHRSEGAEVARVAGYAAPRPPAF
jgi:Zn-dependent protease